MLLILLYIALAALIVWSIVYLIWRIVRSLRGKGGCSCGCGGGHSLDGGCGTHCGGCSGCGRRDQCRK